MGCLLAGCVGDAFASAAEGRAVHRASFTPTWRITDDTQLTWATCEAMGMRPYSVQASDVANQLNAWFARGRFTGLGATTLGALRSLRAGAHWGLSGLGGQYHAGSGAAMRVAPLAFVFDMDDFGQRLRFKDIVRITHKNEEALAGAQAVLFAIQYLSQNPTPKPLELLHIVRQRLFDSQIRDNIQRLIEDDIRDYPSAAQTIGVSGFVAQAVPVALAGAQHGANTNLQDLWWDIVCHGGDTDTIASIAGQFVGAAGGFDRSAYPEVLARYPKYVQCVARLSGNLR